MPRRYNPKQTSPQIAKLAGDLLQDEKTPAKTRKVSASALVQAKPKIKTKSKVKKPKPKK